MADQSAQVKKITDNIEATFQELRKVAKNISGLLAVGRATCDEIKAYNLYALAIYDVQRGSLASLRASGEAGVPDHPPYPTMFAWKGVSGENAWKIDCSKDSGPVNGPSDRLTSALSSAFASAAQPGTKFLSSKEIQIMTSDPFVFSPDKNMPSLEEITNQAHNAGLGFPVVLVVIVAGIVLAIGAVALAAFAKYLQEKNIQEQTTERTKLQVQAFNQYTATRMNCYDSCINKGGSIDSCIKTCKSLVDKPVLDVTPRSGIDDDAGGTLSKIGFIVVAGVGAIALLKLYQRGTFDNMFSKASKRSDNHHYDDED